MNIQQLKKRYPHAGESPSRCPKCGSEKVHLEGEIDYGSGFVEGAWCFDCGQAWEVHYKYVHSMTRIVHRLTDDYMIAADVTPQTYDVSIFVDQY